MSLTHELLWVPVVSAGFNVLIDNVVKEFLKFVGSKESNDVELLWHRLRTTVLTLTAVLNEAKQKQTTNIAVLEWLEELVVVMYDAEDVVDEMQTEALRRKIQHESKIPGNNSNDHAYTDDDDQVKYNYTSCITAKLRNICDRLDVFLPQVTVLGLGKCLKEDKKIPVALIPPTSMNYKGHSIVGRESQKLEVIYFFKNHQQENNNDLNLVVIVGLAGVGKTTFAQQVYGDTELEAIFNLKSWVSMPALQESDDGCLVKAVLKSIIGKHVPGDSLQTLQGRLSKAVLGKSFLVVLDAVVDIDSKNWDNLLVPLKNGMKSSCIIITSHNDCENLVVSSARSLQINLEPLCYDDSRLLLQTFVFKEGEGDIEAVKESIDVIATKCKGLPLAGKLLGGILRYTRNVEDWDVISKSKLWDAPGVSNGILPALRLSYNYLPSHLKRCFAYCSIFPKGFRFEREQLVLLWIAEGFVHMSRSDQVMEEIGNNYFYELVSRSLFQKVALDIIHYYEMHELVHDLAQHASGDLCFMKKAKEHKVCPSKTRHFSYIQSNHDDFKYFEYIEGHVHFESLRTFFPLNFQSENLCSLNKKGQSFLPKLISLRVLSLSHYDICDILHPPSGFKHLRFLDLSRTSIEHLPHFVCSLYNLQTLLLRDCPYLTILSERIGDLVSLRHLRTNGSSNLQEMPPQITRLNKIRTMTNFVVGKNRGAKISALREFYDLRGHLTISALHNVDSELDASKASLMTKKYLDELTLEWGGQTQYSPIDEHICHLLKPNKNLKRLTIKSYGGRTLASWMGDGAFCNIVYMHLKNCCSCSELPSLGQLPCLQKLYIEDFTVLNSIGMSFYGNSDKPFQCLQTLSFKNMPEWKTWLVHQGIGQAFDNLQEFYLLDCPRLSEQLPMKLPSTKKFEIIRCGELTGSLPELPSVLTLRLQACGKLDLRSISNLNTLVFFHIRDLSIHNSFTSNLQRLTSLRELDIGYCNPIPSILSNGNITRPVTGYTIEIGDTLTDLSILGCDVQTVCPTSSLRSLNISHCRNLELTTNCFALLRSLEVSRCGSLESFLFELFPQLIHLKIEGCPKLKAIMVPQAYDLPCLYELQIISCRNLRNFTSHGLPAGKLAIFSISNCENLRFLPGQMNSNLCSLQYLSIVCCPKLELFPDDGFPPCLRTLQIRSCPKLMANARIWGAQLPPSLTLDLDIPVVQR